MASTRPVRAATRATRMAASSRTPDRCGGLRRPVRWEVRSSGSPRGVRGGMRAGLCLAAAPRVPPRLAFRERLPEEAAGAGAVGAGLAGAGALDLGRRTAGQFGQGAQDLEDVAQLLDQGGRADPSGPGRPDRR